MPDNPKNKDQRDKETPNRRTFVVRAKAVGGRRDRVMVTSCSCCGRAHPNIDIIVGLSGGHYYNCPVTDGVVYVRVD